MQKAGAHVDAATGDAGRVLAGVLRTRADGIIRGWSVGVRGRPDAPRLGARRRVAKALLSLALDWALA